MSTSTAITDQLINNTNQPRIRSSEDEEKLKQLLLSLPKERGWRTPHLYLFQNFWCTSKVIQAIISSQTHFNALPSDILLATIPKSGTTWLKALAFAVVHRHAFPLRSHHAHPLLTSNPHDLVPFLEYKLYANGNLPDLSSSAAEEEEKPVTLRIFATHVPFAALPESVKSSSCRLVYLCRNPLDTFVSSWHFLKKARPEAQLGPLSMEEAFDMYCRGVVGFGPHWEHLLGYWKQSRERPEKVLFLKYEEMKDATGFHVKRLAEFLGCPFSAEEERGGVIEDICRLCSFDNMKDLEVNKSGKSIACFENASLFRKGEVGDWVNHLTPSMAERLRNVMETKLEGSGLSFKFQHCIN